MKNYFFLISSTCNWPWKDTLGCRVSLLWHLQFRCNEPVLHLCKMQNGQITFHRKIFWTIFLHHIIGHDQLHFCAKERLPKIFSCEELFARFAFHKNSFWDTQYNASFLGSYLSMLSRFLLYDLMQVELKNHQNQQPLKNAGERLKIRTKTIDVLRLQ